MTIGTLLYKVLSNKSLFNAVKGSYRTPTPTATLGTISLSSAASKFGGYSAYLNAVGYIYANSNSIFNYGTNNYTIEGYFNSNSVTGTQFIFDQRPDANSIIAPVIYSTGTQIIFYLNGSVRITASWTPTVGVWYHIALVKYNNVTKLYIDGTAVAQTYTDNNTYVQGGNLNIGGTYSLGSNQWKGYVDEVRISNVARYTANFSPITTRFNNDVNTLLLLHLDTDYADYVY